MATSASCSPVAPPTPPIDYRRLNSLLDSGLYALDDDRLTTPIDDCAYDYFKAALALVPLAEGALRNVGAHGTTDGLTGPVRRGDAVTVRKHLEALQGRPELVEIYRALARRAVDIASRIDGRDAPDRAGLDEIRAILK